MLSVAAPYQDRLILPINIILGWNLLAVTNTLAYYNAVLISAVKKFYCIGFWFEKLNWSNYGKLDENKVDTYDNALPSHAYVPL